MIPLKTIDAHAGGGPLQAHHRWCPVGSWQNDARQVRVVGAPGRRCPPHVDARAPRPCGYDRRHAHRAGHARLARGPGLHDRRGIPAVVGPWGHRGHDDCNRAPPAGPRRRWPDRGLRHDGRCHQGPRRHQRAGKGRARERSVGAVVRASRRAVGPGRGPPNPRRRGVWRGVLRGRGRRIDWSLDRERHTCQLFVTPAPKSSGPSTLSSTLPTRSMQKPRGSSARSSRVRRAPRLLT